MAAELERPGIHATHESREVAPRIDVLAIPGTRNVLLVASADAAPTRTSDLRVI